MPARYAVYYVPEAGSTLETLGSALLGRNAAGADVPRPWLNLPAPLRPEDITATPRHYGLHATLKAPFALAPGRTATQLREAVRALAQRQHALLLPPLEVGTVPDGRGGEGNFLALRPEASCASLQDLAARCVRELDAFRAALAPQDLARRPNLTPRQTENLRSWGYPHVLEDFHFHITLTDPLEDPAQRREVAEALRGLLAEACAPRRIPMRGLVLVRQADRRQPFRLVAAFPFKPVE